MEVQPMKRYAGPALPTRAALDANPELLRLAPKRWQRNAVVLAALGTACTIGTLRWAHAQAQQPASRVAPLFVHGEGRGSFGCIAVNPPVFLSEDEARLLIVEELRKAGMTMTADRPTIARMAIPLTSQYEFTEDDERQERTHQPVVNRRTQQGALVLDGTDTRRHVSYEYVSDGDFKAWETKDWQQVMPSSVYSINTKVTAGVLRGGLVQAKPSGAYGVFYDPMMPIRNLEGLTTVGEFTDATLAPVRWFADFASAGIVVSDGGQTVTITGKEHKVVLKAGSAQALVDGKPIEMPAKVAFLYGSPYAPARFLAGQLGIDLTWDGRAELVEMHYPGANWAPTSQVRAVPAAAGRERVTAVFVDMDWEAKQGYTKGFSRDELRQQVRNFVAWLKAEGVI